MKKVFLALPLFAGVAWAGTTYLSSTQSREAYEQLLATLNGRETLRFESESYESGFSSSSAVTRVLAGEGEDQALVVRLHHAIDHTPVSLGEGDSRLSAARIVTTLYRDSDEGSESDDSDSEVSLFDEELTEFLAGFGDAEPFTATTDISFTGQSSNRIEIAPYALDIDGGQFSLDGADMRIDIGGERLTGEGTVGAMVIVPPEDNTEITVSASRFDYDLDAQRAHSLVGAYSYAIDEIKVVLDGAPLVTLGDTTLHGDSKLVESSDTYDGFFTLAVDRILSPAPVDSASWTTEIGGLAAAVIDDYNKAYWRDPSSISDTQNMQNMVRLKGLLQPDAFVGQKVSLANAGGNIDTNFGVTWLTPTAEFEAAMPVTVGDLLSHMRLELNLDADVPAVQSTPAVVFLANPIAQAYIEEKDGKYLSNITVADGVLTANGAAMPLDAVVGDLVNMPLSMMVPRPAPTEQ